MSDDLKARRTPQDDLRESEYDPAKAVARALVRHRGDSEHEPYADTCQECLAEACAAIAAYREALEASGWRIVDEATLRDAASAVQGLNSASATVKGREFHERLARLYRDLRSAVAPDPTE